jgi:hypothetical protein
MTKEGESIRILYIFRLVGVEDIVTESFRDGQEREVHRPCVRP